MGLAPLLDLGKKDWQKQMHHIILTLLHSIDEIFYSSESDMHWKMDEQYNAVNRLTYTDSTLGYS
jgi:hypothetical protein